MRILCAYGKKRRGTHPIGVAQLCHAQQQMINKAQIFYRLFFEQANYFRK
nr:MAG TPA: hypothetical protein [Caudoviricetes sp.]